MRRGTRVVGCHVDLATRCARARVSPSVRVGRRVLRPSQSGALAASGSHPCTAPRASASRRGFGLAPVHCAWSPPWACIGRLPCVRGSGGGSCFAAVAAKGGPPGVAGPYPHAPVAAEAAYCLGRRTSRKAFPRRYHASTLGGGGSGGEGGEHTLSQRSKWPRTVDKGVRMKGASNLYCRRALHDPCRSRPSMPLAGRPQGLQG